MIPYRHLLLIIVAALLVRGSLLMTSHHSLEADPDAYRLIGRVLREHHRYAVPSWADDRESTTQQGKHVDAVDEDASRQLVSTAYRPPLYPILLAALTPGGRASPLAVALLHLVFGVMTSVLVWWAAYQWLGGALLRAYAAAIFVIMDPLLLKQSTQVMTETVAAGFAITIIYAASRALQSSSWRWAMGAGLAIGLASLCRPTFLPLVIAPGIVAFMMMFPRGRATSDHGARENVLARPTRQSWRIALTSILVASFVVAPWVVRNRLVMGRWIASTTHGGYTLLLGNNDSFYRYLCERRPGEVWQLDHPAQLLDEACVKLKVAPHMIPSSPTPDLSASVAPGVAARSDEDVELWRDDMAYRAARQTIAEQPQWFARACIDRVVQFWRVLPHAQSAQESSRARLVRWAIGGWYCVVLGLAVAGCLTLLRAARHAVAAERRGEVAAGTVWNWEPWLWIAVVLIVFQAAHLIYWSNMRMRAPVMPAVALLAAAAGHRFHSREKI